MIDWGTGNVPVEHDYTHPERHFKGLVATKPFKNHRNVHNYGRYGEYFDKDYKLYAPGETDTVLCWACGWTAYEQTTSAYGPRIRIMHARDNMGLWSIGSKWLIRDQPNDHSLGADYMTWKFLQEQPGLTIPLVKMQLLSDPKDPIQFTLMSRAQGTQLVAVWHKLTPEQKDSYRDQMVDILKQLRQFTAPLPQRVNGDQLDDNLVGLCRRRHSPTCIKMGWSMEEWFENMSDDLRFGLSEIHNTKDPKVIEEKLQELKDNFPSGEPYVLSHADLNLTNIIVKDNKIEAIIDWEMAGYYPWWAEVFAAGLVAGDAEAEFFEGVNGVFAKVHPDLDRDSPAFKSVMNGLVPVIRAFKRTTIPAEHIPPDDAAVTGFWRPPFCKCHPFGGLIKDLSLGLMSTHKAKDYKVWDDEMYDLNLCIIGKGDS